ncbi:MAG: 8-oxo-dGTP diphosphatase [Patescibacteria group bacterium]|jgi:8-oxo-dGTP diphosphatase|nr:8-oxo-dGTP diphosphatase [Patescibacteria group bacterium]
MSGDFKTVTTLSYLINSDNQVLLVYKKRGFGVGKWNGPGGKVEPFEDPKASAIREIKEEVGITVSDLAPMGLIEFVWPDELVDNNTVCYLFMTKDFFGKPVESEECRPQWFNFDDIPYGQMWDDDQYWYPLILRGQVIKKRFFFDQNSKVTKQEDI